MSNEDDQKRHISHVISAIRDDDTDNEAPSGRSERKLDEPGYSTVEDRDEEYYVNEEERRQWDYEESNPATLDVDDNGSARAESVSGRSAGLGMLLDWRLVAALAILVAGLFMVNFSGNRDEVSGVDGQDEPRPEVLAQLEARIDELERRLAAVAVGGVGGETPVVGPIPDSGSVATKDELQVLRDQVNAGLKAQEDTTRTAVRDLEQRLTSVIDTKVAAASRPTSGQASGTTQAQSQPQSQASAGAWFVNVATYSQRATADAMVERLREGGRSAAIVPATIGGEPSYRVRVVDLPSRDAAQRAARELESQLGLRGLWVGEN